MDGIPGFLGVPEERSFELPVEASAARPFEYNVLVILVEFADVRADREHHPPVFYHRRFFAGSEASPSLADYYRANSGGRFKVSGFVTEWVRLDSTYAWYTSEGPGNGGGGIDPNAYPNNAQRLVEEAVAKVGHRYDWDKFDNNQDGLADGLFVIHAGPGADETSGLESFDPERLLAHQFHVKAEMTVPGGLAFDYAIADEAARIGVIAHEFGHLLGLIDLYPVNSIAGGDGPYGLGDWSLMGTGALLGSGEKPANLDPWSRHHLGFLEPEVIQETNGQVVSFGPGEDTVLKLWGSSGTTEYFLVEARYRTGFDVALPAEGVLIYHVDERVQTNSSSSHPRVMIEQADARWDLNRPGGNRGDVGDPFPNAFSPLDRDEFDGATNPGSGSYTGTPSNVALYNIRRTETGHQAEVVVLPPPSIRFGDFRVHELEGDGDGVVERGETATVDATVENAGASLVEGDLFVVFTPTEQSAVRAIDPVTSGHLVGNLERGERRELTDAFRFTFRPSAAESAGTFPFNSIVACSECLPQQVQTIVLVSLGQAPPAADDFETGAPGWTHAALNPVQPDLWHLDTERARSGTRSFAFSAAGQPYDPGADAVLVTPSWRVPEGGRFSFWQSIDAETLATTRAWDGGRVEVSVSGGAWRVLEPVDGYPFRLESGSGNPLFDQEVLSGHAADFRRVVLDVSDLAGAQVRFRFRFATDLFGDPEQVERGWFIDDVALAGGEEAVQVAAGLEEGGVRVSWSLPAPPADAVRWEILRREDLAGSRAEAVGAVDVAAGTASWEFRDFPLPGRYIYEVQAVEAEGLGLRGAAAPIDVSATGSAARLAQPYPAPYHVSGPPARVDWFVPESAAGQPLRVEIFDVAGRLVRTLVNGPAVAGMSSAWWTGEAHGGRAHSGVYFVRLVLDGRTAGTHRLLVVS